MSRRIISLRLATVTFVFVDVGAIAGISPAARAAQLSPADATRPA